MRLELKSLGSGVGHLKAGFLGFAGSGKTHTAITLAIGARESLGLSGPIALFDTEAGAQYVAPRVKDSTGLDLLGVQSRSFDDSVQFLRLCMDSGVSVAVIDSVSHTWRELTQSYVRKRNEKRGKGSNRIEFQEWATIKGMWAQFSDLYLNAPLHVIICGRAGYEYDYEEREDGSGKDLMKTGVRMKTEGEFGFEPSLLVEMQRVPVEEGGKATARFTHRALVLKDRFNVIDGREADNPGFEFFRPFVNLLSEKGRAVVDTERSTDVPVDEEGHAEWQREKRLRTVACEEIQGILTNRWPGQSAAEKKEKVDAIFAVFGTRSWTAIENMSSTKLSAGLDSIRARVLGGDVPTDEARPISSEPAEAAS